MYSYLLFEYFPIFESPTKDTVYILFILQEEGLNREWTFSFFG